MELTQRTNLLKNIKRRKKLIYWNSFLCLSSDIILSDFGKTSGFVKNLIQEFVFRVFRSKAVFGQIFNNFKSTNLDFDWDSGFPSKP